MLWPNKVPLQQETADLVKVFSSSRGVRCLLFPLLKRNSTRPEKHKELDFI